MTADDYRMAHQPPEPDYGAPLHDVEMMMPDFYEHPEYYRTGDDECDWWSVRAVFAARGRAGHLTQVWRAVPTPVVPPGIRPGDWVTTSRPYARQHGERGGEPYGIATRLVPAGELYSEGDSINEWGWWPGDR